MRESIKQFVRIAAETLPIQEPIYEFGALQVEGQEGFADLRPLFPNKEYIGTDMREGLGVDKILNLHEIELPDSSVGTVLILDTLEHVELPHQSLNEVHRILKQGGIVIISSVMNYPIHNYPSDYWRFTPEGFKSLLRLFNQRFADFAGDERFPHTIVGIGIKDKNIILSDFLLRFDLWKQRWNGKPSNSSLKALLKLFIPPICIHTYWQLKKINVSKHQYQKK